MRRVCITVITVICLACCAAPAYSGDDAVKKLGRGICNCLSFPLEIPRQMGLVNESDGPLAGATWGTVKGIGMALARGIVGVYETATFPIPVPAYYNPIITDPEFMFDDISL